jgi:hypothetical protein
LSEPIARDAFLSALDDTESELKRREREPINLDVALKLAQPFEVFTTTVETSSNVRHSVNRQRSGGLKTARERGTGTWLTARRNSPAMARAAGCMTSGRRATSDCRERRAQQGTRAVTTPLASPFGSHLDRFNNERSDTSASPRSSAGVAFTTAIIYYNSGKPGHYSRSDRGTTH